MRERICGIYKVKNKLNGKVYIGQSVSILDRWYEHKKNRTKRDTVFQNALAKYGIDNFEFEILEECKPEELNDLEIKYIQSYNSCILFKNHNGYNMTTGGDGSYDKSPPTKETKEKIRKSLTGRKLNLSKDAIMKKIEVAKKINAKTVICDGVEYETISDFAKTFNLNPTTVSTWIRGKRTMPIRWLNLGLRFKDEETYILKRLSKYSASKAVICEGVIYGTVRECAEHYKINPDTMRGWLSGKRGMPQKWINMNLSYLDNTRQSNIKDRHIHSSRKVICDGVVYNSIKECANHYNVNAETMRRWLRGTIRMSKEFEEKGLHYYI